jgi:hypothetical protein
MMKKSVFGLAFSLLFLMGLLIGCGSQEAEPTTVPTPIADLTATAVAAATPTPPPPTEPILALAMVDSIQILTLESFPVQVNVQVRGNLPDGCTNLNETVSQRDGNAFSIAMTTLRDPNMMCTQALVPFTEMVPLEVVGLEAGTYSVSVNGITGSFTLAVDNVLESETEAEATAEATGSIEGRLWHDLCVVIGNETAPGGGCVAITGGGFTADGLLDEDEPGIEGVTVNLGAGACPAVGLETAVTDPDGFFSFTNLEPGDYCVSIDDETPDNEAILLPGQWTIPASGLAQFNVSLTAEQSAISGVNFGWDYEFLPLPENAADCLNSIEFIDDLNIPDDTALLPGAEFTKRWLLRNNGTCVWTTDYSLAFVGGDQMDAPDSVSLTQPIAPGQPVEVAVTMTAPATPGTYRGNWQMADATGQLFGIDGILEDAFWLQIVVSADATPLATPAPNSAALGGIVWDDFCINSNPGRGCWEFPTGSGNFIGDGSQASNEPPLANITISLASGVCPQGGTIPTNPVVLRQMVTGEDGRYRFDNLPGGTYCVFMDALSSDNVDRLIPGNWTWPAVGVGTYTIALREGEQRLNLDFGWDFTN